MSAQNNIHGAFFINAIYSFKKSQQLLSFLLICSTILTGCAGLLVCSSPDADHVVAGHGHDVVVVVTGGNLRKKLLESESNVHPDKLLVNLIPTCQLNLDLDLFNFSNSRSKDWSKKTQMVLSRDLSINKLTKIIIKLI